MKYCMEVPNEQEENPLCQSVTEVFECIAQLEQEYDLFEKKIDEIYYWPLIRFDLQLDVCKALNLFPGERTEENSEPTGKGGRFAQRIAGIIDLPSLITAKSRYCIILHERRKRLDDTCLDPYTSWLDDKSLGVHPTVIDPSKSERVTNYPSHRYHRMNTLLSLSSKLNTVFRTSRTNFYSDFFELIEAKIRHKTGANTKLEPLVESAIRHFRTVRSAYRTLFRVLKTKELFIVVAYCQHGIVAAAHDVGALVHEVQHGTISRFHVGYSFPGCPQVPYYPDTLLTIGEFWSQQLELPANTRCLVAGSNAVTSSLVQSRAIERKRQIVLISQWSLGALMVPYAVELAKALPSFQIVFRLHPNDDQTIFKGWMPPGFEDNHPNFRWSTKSESLWDLFLASEIQIGVYSTALYEGMVCGCRTVVLRLPGWEQMAGAIERGDAQIATSLEDLMSTVSSAPRAAAPEDYFSSLDSQIINRLNSAYGLSSESR